MAPERKHRELGIGLIVTSATILIGAAVVWGEFVGARPKHPEWWVFWITLAAGVTVLLLGVRLYSGYPRIIPEQLRRHQALVARERQPLPRAEAGDAAFQAARSHAEALGKFRLGRYRWSVRANQQTLEELAAASELSRQLTRARQLISEGEGYENALLEARGKMQTADPDPTYFAKLFRNEISQNLAGQMHDWHKRVWQAIQVPQLPASAKHELSEWPEPANPLITGSTPPVKKLATAVENHLDILRQLRDGLLQASLGGGT